MWSATSRLAGADEERTLARLRALRSDLIDPTIAVHHGRVVKRTGDGSHCRVPQRGRRGALRDRGAERPWSSATPAYRPRRRIEFRVGIHLGDVVEESDGDLMGDGVNIAARLQGVCEPGGVCLSGAAHEQVRDRLKECFADLGEKQLKNIARPIRAFGLSAAAIGAARTGGSGAAPTPKARGTSLRWPAIAAALVVAVLAAGAYVWHAGFASRLQGLSVAEDKLATAPRLSIVVLPFENLTGDPDQQFFADGIVDDLTTDLSHLPESFVIARGTAFTYKGKSVDAKQIGRELGVRYMLEGSVAASAKTSPSTPNWSRPRPARMSGPSGSTGSAASSANCRWNS